MKKLLIIFFIFIFTALAVFSAIFVNNITTVLVNKNKIQGTNLINYGDFCKDYSSSNPILRFIPLPIKPCYCDYIPSYGFNCQVEIISLCEMTGGHNESIENGYFKCNCPEGMFFFDAYGCVSKDTCGELQDEFLTGKCLVGKAQYFRDINICDMIKNNNYAECIRSVVNVTGKEEYCDKLLTSENKYISAHDVNRCISTAAIFHKDVKYCEKIKDQGCKDDCYRCVAEETIDASLCEKIVTQSWKDICYYGVAKDTKNRGLCEKIVDESEKKYCYQTTR